MQIVPEVVCSVNDVVYSLATGIAKKLPSRRTRTVSIKWLKWIQENEIENSPILGALPRRHYLQGLSDARNAKSIL